MGELIIVLACFITIAALLAALLGTLDLAWYLLTGKGIAGNKQSILLGDDDE